MVASLLLAGVVVAFYFQDITPSFLKEGLSHSRSVIIQDIDGDGDKDIFLCSPLPGMSRLLENIGGESFFDVTEAWRIDLSSGFRKVLFGDLDGDGSGDLILFLNLPNVPPRILKNSGERYFTEQRDNTLQSYVVEDLSLLDWNNDENLDLLLVLNFPEPRVQLLLNQGGADFRNADIAFPIFPYDSITSTNVLDLDADGFDDLLFTTKNSFFAVLNAENPTRVPILEDVESPQVLLLGQEGKETPTILIFQAHTQRAFLLSPDDLKLEEITVDEETRLPGNSTPSDLDLDGLPEIIGISDEGFPLILNFRNGEIQAAPWLAPSGYFLSVHTGDLTGDGAADIIFLGKERPYFLANTGPRGHFLKVLTKALPLSRAVAIYSQNKVFRFPLLQQDNILGLGSMTWIDSIQIKRANLKTLTLYNFPCDTQISPTSPDVEEAKSTSVREDTSLVKVMPNPSSLIFTFTLNLEEKKEIELQVISASGAIVEDIASGVFEPGDYTFTWNASGYVPGHYLLRVSIDKRSFLRKLILLR